MHRILYLLDPLCGWCYGAAPMLDRLMAQEDLAVELIPTGLFADDGAFPMNDAFARHAWESDLRIAQLSGQRFTEEYRLKVLGDRSARVDSGPATLALTAVRLTTPGREWETLKAIQQVRYVDGRDNGDPAVIADVLSGLGLEEAAARFATADDELLSVCRIRIAEGQVQMRHFGARGVPTLIAGDGQSPRMVNASALFGDLDSLMTELKAT
ncbi:DsbA family protein [Marinobacterium aestuariivivens]|uniref:DsbA family protein n=1 Tax=Marinobacterium aestuariivivens TaxID=1698799 RepID=A0ABW2A781_9GAMM